MAPVTGGDRQGEPGLISNIGFLAMIRALTCSVFKHLEVGPLWMLLR